MKVSQKALEYILLLLIVAIAFCAYQFGYKHFKDKADAVKKENKSIEARIQQLNDKLALQPEYEKGIEDSAKTIDEVVAKYGSGNSPEKSLIFIRDLETAAGMSISSVSFSGDSNIFTSTATDAETGEPAITADTTTLGVTYSTTYEGLKACMDYINAYPERMNVSNFTSVFNQETGGLSGSMVMNLYSVLTGDREYVEPVIGGIEIGTDNIFGTVDLEGMIAELGEALEGAGEAAPAAE